MSVVQTAGKMVLAAGITLLVVACASEPATQAVSAGAAADGKVAQEVAQSDKKICRSEKVTGTNFPKRICFTAEQWNEVDKKQSGDAHSFTDHVLENAAVTNAKNCGQSGQVASC